MLNGVGKRIINIMAALGPLLGSLRRGGGAPEIICIVCLLWFPEGNPRKRRLASNDTSSWGSARPFLPRRENRGNPKVPESLGNKPKTLLLVKSCRSVPLIPETPRADRERRLTGPRPAARFLHHGAAPSPRAPLVRVDGSRKLPQISVYSG